MAINLNQQNPNNPQGQQQGPQAAGAQPQQDQFKPRGTGFTNLKSVLGANKNNQLGQTIGAGVQNITNKTQGQTQQAQNQFAKDIGQSVEDIKKGTQVQQNLSNIDFSKNPDEASQKLQEVGGEDYASAAANLRGGYKGPQGFSNQDQLQSQAQQLGQTAQGLMTQGGRQAALQRFVNAGPNYTQGKQQLDTMLLGQNQQALTQARRQAAQTATGTNEALQQAAQQGQYTGQTYNTLGQNIGATAENAIGGFQKAFTDPTTGRVVTAQQKANTDISSLQDALKNNNLTDEQMQQVQGILGTSDIGTMSGADISNLLQAHKYQLGDVVNQQDIASRDALARLSGKQGTDILNAQAPTGQINELEGTSQTADVVKAQQAAMDAARSGFNINAPTTQQAFQDFNNRHGNIWAASTANPLAKNALNYQDVKAINDIKSKYGGNIDLSNPEVVKSLVSSGIITDPNSVKFSAGQQNVSLGGDSFGHEYTDEDANNMVKNEFTRVQQQQLNNALQQYQDTNTKYGLGRSLSDLLSRNKKDTKTYGVS